MPIENLPLNSSNQQRFPTGLNLSQSIIVFVLSCFCFVTVLGNSLVICAVIKEHYLKSVTYYYMASLACADLFVGLIVMPVAIVQLVYGDFWPFGKLFCDLWHSIDVFASTASILDLCVIALDRYSAIRNPILYHRAFFVQRWPFLLAIVWLCSALISFPAIAYWRSVSQNTNNFICLFPDDIFYILISSSISFYIPLFVMVFVYIRIYRVAVRQLRAFKTGVKLTTTKQMKSKLNPTAENPMVKISAEVCLRVHRGKYRGLQFEHDSLTEGSISHYSIVNDPSSLPNGRKKNLIQEKNRQTFGKRLTKFSKEQKATITLAYVMGIFVICWLPFFVYNPLTVVGKAFISSKHPLNSWQQFLVGNDIVFQFVTWFGYMNSSVNPIIYAYSSREFRRAFVKYFCRCIPARLRRFFIARRRIDLFSSRNRPSSFASAENGDTTSDKVHRQIVSTPSNSTSTTILVKLQNTKTNAVAFLNRYKQRQQQQQQQQQVSNINQEKSKLPCLVDYCTYHNVAVSRVTCL